MHKQPICACLALLSCLAGQAVAGEPQTATEYRIAPGESEINVLVFRAGALGRLGHNHVVTARELDGRVMVAETPGASALELTVPVAALRVDDPEARSTAGPAFEGEVSEDDRAGTRRNMLGPRLLDAAHYPEVHVRSTLIRGSFDDLLVTADIDIRGTRHAVELPVNAVLYGDRLVATGRAQLTHEDLGLTPFTAGFGTLRVADELTLKFRIVAVTGHEGDDHSRGERALTVVEHDGAALADRTPE